MIALSIVIGRPIVFINLLEINPKILDSDPNNSVLLDDNENNIEPESYKRFRISHATNEHLTQFTLVLTLYQNHFSTLLAYNKDTCFFDYSKTVFENEYCNFILTDCD